MTLTRILEKCGRGRRRKKPALLVHENAGLVTAIGETMASPRWERLPALAKCGPGETDLSTSRDTVMAAAKQTKS